MTEEEVKRSSEALKRLTAIILSAVVVISSPQGIVRASEGGEKVSISLIGKYDSADTAAIRDIDTKAKTIRFRNHATGKTYTLSYDNTSMIYDARGTALSASLLEVGQIVDVTFLKSSRHITTLNVSKDAWTIENTRDHELVRGDGTARVQGELYRIDQRTLVMADGSLSLPEDVLATDTVTVSGLGREIYSVMVTGGHGYVSLSSDTVEDHSLVGAWLELDNEVIHRISPNMLLSAPEGDYNLQILGNGANYTSEVSIDRNKETVVDTSSVNITKPKEGLVTFQIIPETAEVFVDGEKVLTDTPQSIRYGYHNLKIVAEGYETQDKYLKIGTAKSVISIELEKEGASDSKSSSETSGADVGDASSSSSEKKSLTPSTADVSEIANSSASGSTISENSSGENTKPASKVIEGYKIYFDKPYGAELYFDGSYIGMIPVSVPKVSGSHEVILKKDGYETKSYRVSIDKDEVDLNYTFPDLVEIKDDDEDVDKDKDRDKDKNKDKDSSSGDDSSKNDSSSSDDSSSKEDTTPADDSSSDDSASGDDTSASDDASTGDDSSQPGDASAGESGAASDSSGSEDGRTGEDDNKDNNSDSSKEEGSSATEVSGADSQTKENETG